MRLHAFLAAAVVTGALVGCMHEPNYVGDGFQPINVNEGVPRTARSQKADAETAKPAPPKSLLDMPPERPGDPNVTQVCASIRAVVNGKALLNEEVREACFVALQQAKGNPAKQKEIVTNTLELLVERELLVQDAHARLDKSPQGKKFLEKVTDFADKEFDRWLRGLKSNLQLKNDDEVKDWLLQQGLS